MSILRFFVGVTVALLMSTSPILSQKGPRDAASEVIDGKDVSSVTEEGQRVIYDRYTWQMRELSKRLPLDQPWPAQVELGAFFAKYGMDKTGPAGDIPVPLKISPNVYLVGSTDALAYLIDCGKGAAAIIDPGFERSVDTVLANAAKVGFERSSIKWILNTHSHGDHSHGDAKIVRLTGAQLMIGAGDADAIEKPVPFKTPPGAKIMPMPAATPVKVDRRLEDGDELRLGDRVVKVIHVPGHSPGSMVFLLEDEGKKLLISGDVALFDGRLPAMGLSGMGTNDTQFAAAIGRLAKILESNRPDLLLPGHGTIVLDRAYMDIVKDWLLTEHYVGNGEPISAAPFGVRIYRSLMFGRP